jgi:hypothetical protein
VLDVLIATVSSQQSVLILDLGRLLMSSSKINSCDFSRVPKF